MQLPTKVEYTFRFGMVTLKYHWAFPWKIKWCNICNPPPQGSGPCDLRSSSDSTQMHNLGSNFWGNCKFWERVVAKNLQYGFKVTKLSNMKTLYMTKKKNKPVSSPPRYNNKKEELNSQWHKDPYSSLRAKRSKDPKKPARTEKGSCHFNLEKFLGRNSSFLVVIWNGEGHGNKQQVPLRLKTG